MYAQLRTQIENGELAVDEQLPPELDLANQFGVSRGTARQAVSRLALEGLVERSAGRGTFVSSRPLVFTPRELLGFTEQIRASGRVPSSQVIDVSVVSASTGAHLADFGSDVDQLVSLERVRLADGEPIALEHMLLPFPRFAGLRDIHLEDRSVYDTLEEVFGAQLTMGEFSLDIANLNKRQSELLNERVHSAAFVMAGSVRDQQGVTIVSVRAYYRRNKFSFTFSTPRGSHTPIHYAHPRLVVVPTSDAADSQDLSSEG